MYFQPKVIYRNPDTPRLNSIVRYIGNRVLRNNKNFLCAQVGCQIAGSKVLMADGSWKRIENIEIGDTVSSPEIEGKPKFTNGKVIAITKWLCLHTYDLLDEEGDVMYSCSNNHIIPYYFNDKIKYSKSEMLKGKWIETIKYNLIRKEYDKVKVKVMPSTENIVYGFTLDSSSSLYITNNWMVTHNSTGSGKCQPAGSKVLMADGSWENIEDIKLGDVVSSPAMILKSSPALLNAQVTHVHSWLCKSTYNLIDKQNKIMYSCSDNHLVPYCKEESIEYLEAHELRLRWIEIPKYNPLTKQYKKIEVKVTPSSEKKVYGFTIDSPTSLYITDNWMVTHNSWSCLSIAEIYSKMYDIPFDPKVHVISSLHELLTLVTSTDADKKIRFGSFIVFDEPQIEGNARNWQSEMNQALSQLISTFRNQRLVVFFATPMLEMIDKQSRILFHGEFKVMGFDKNTGMTQIKPRFLEYNKKKNDFYRKRLIIEYKNPSKTKVSRTKLNLWHVSKPSQEIIEVYEAKKKKFTEDLNKKLLAKIEMSERQTEFRDKNVEFIKIRELFEKYGEDYLKISEEVPHMNPYTIEKYIKFIKRSIKSKKLMMGAKV